ncbi:MAG: hypothetical protein RL660_2810 [Bacteroidota bacterium]|jgi:hypothetical protein
MLWFGDAIVTKIFYYCRVLMSTSNVIYGSLSKIPSQARLCAVLHIQKQAIGTCLLDTNTRQILYLAQHQPSDSLVDGDFLAEVTRDFKKLQIASYVDAVDDPRQIVFPTIFDTEQQVHALFRNHHFVEANEAILQQSIPWKSMSGYFAAKQEAMQLLHHHMPQVQIVQAQLCGLHNFLDNPETDIVYLQIAHKYFSLSYFDKKLMLHNTFEYQSSIDMVYQLHKLCEVYQLNNDIAISISGVESVNHIAVLKKQYNNVKHNAHPAGLLYLPQMSTQQHEPFVTLYLIAKACVS